MAGQPSKCTPETIQKLADYIRAGVAIKYAAEACGISPDAFHLWMREGKKDFESENPHTAYANFFTTIAGIRAEFIKEAVDNIKKAGRTNKNWQANTWLLEKLYAAGYGKDSTEVLQLAKDMEQIKRILGAELDPTNAHNQQGKPDDQESDD